MKKFRRKISVMLIAVVLGSCFAPLVYGDLTAAEKKEKNNEDICSYAKEDAFFESNTCLWQAAGLLLGPVGVILGFFILPPVPPSRIMGRPSAYVEQYTTCFNDSVKMQNFWASAWYCGFTSVVVLGYFFVLPILFHF